MAVIIPESTVGHWQEGNWCREALGWDLTAEQCQVFWTQNSQPRAAASAKYYCPGEDTSSLSILDLLISFRKIRFSSSCPTQCFELGSALPFPLLPGKRLPLRGEASSDALFSGCKGSGEVNQLALMAQITVPLPSASSI